jgi:hypothetical protein
MQTSVIVIAIGLSQEFTESERYIRASNRLTRPDVILLFLCILVVRPRLGRSGSDSGSNLSDFVGSGSGHGGILLVLSFLIGLLGLHLFLFPAFNRRRQAFKTKSGRLMFLLDALELVLDIVNARI